MKYRDGLCYALTTLRPGRRSPTLVPLRVDKIGLDPEHGQAVILLKDDEGRRYLPISVGPFEANAIALAIQGVETPRPMTHDLLKNVLETFKAKVTHVLIDDLRETEDGTGTFYAQIALDVEGNEVEIDSRPSDAIALAVRTGAPIYALEKVLTAAAVPEDADGPPVH
ncbi:MAG TPA: hypothetical protein DGR79_07565 [Clostridiales bacterium]|nr:hypothetical protein [Clostridiales bacterium]